MERPTGVGGFIHQRRALELQLTQAEVCQVLGWKAWYLSDIEKGKITLTRQKLEQLFGVLQISNEDAGQGYFLAGLPPTEHELDIWVSETEGFIESFAVPAIFRDYTGKLLNANSPAKETFPFAAGIKGKRPHWLKVLFDSELRKIPNWDQHAQDHLTFFVADTPFDVRDDWYREALAQVYNSPQFDSFWRQALDEAEFDHPVICGYREVIMPTVYEGETRLAQFARLSRPIFDPRFRVDLYVPKAA